MSRGIFVLMLILSFVGVSKSQTPIGREGNLTVLAGADEPAKNYAEGLARYRVSGKQEPYSEKTAKKHLKALVNWKWHSLENSGFAAKPIYPDVYALAIMPPQVVPFLLKELNNKTKIKAYPGITIGELVLVVLQGHKMRYERGNLGVDWYSPQQELDYSQEMRQEYEQPIRQWWKKVGKKLKKDYFLPKPTSNNSMDVRAKQRLSYLACPLNFSGRGGGFAPRHLSR